MIELFLSGRFTQVDLTQKLLTAILQRFGISSEKIEGKPFSLIKTGDLATYRDTLIERGKLPADAGGLVRSTIRHRASSLISLQLRHIDVSGKRAIQDGAYIRAKNGKSYTANWFPRTEPLQHIIVEWIDELRSIGLEPDDALFPPDKHLAATAHQPSASRPPVVPMKTQAAVTETFRQASLQSDHKYSGKPGIHM